MSNERVNRRVLAVVALAVVAGALTLVSVGEMGNNLVYYWSPTELVEAGAKAEGATVRLGGLVEAGSIVQSADGLQLDFKVSDGTTQVPVHAEAVPPAMFREGIGVVVEGTLRGDGVFESRRLLVKHDNEYRAPDSEKQHDVKDLMKTMHLDEDGT